MYTLKTLPSLFLLDSLIFKLVCKALIIMATMSYFMRFEWIEGYLHATFFCVCI